MLTVTICEDESIVQSFIERMTHDNSRLSLVKSFSNHIELLSELVRGYRTDIYVIDLLLRAQSQNFGYKIIKLLRELQPDALIIVSSQIETADVRRDLSNYRIQSILDKTGREDEDWSSLLSKSLLALSRGLRCDNPGIDVHELLDSTPLSEQKLDNIKLDPTLKEVFKCLIATWHIRDGAFMCGCSKTTFRLRITELCHFFGVSDDNPLNGLWQVSVKRKFWLPEPHLKQRGISLNNTSKLSNDERLLLKKLANGESIEEIAEKEKLAITTVYGRVRSIKEKTGAKTAVDLWALSLID